MNLNEYQRIITSPERQGELSPIPNRLALTGLGLSGEAGEVNDLLKKLYFHGLDLNPERLAKLELELGDVCWYACFGAHALGVEFQTPKPVSAVVGRASKDWVIGVGLRLATRVGHAATQLSDAVEFFEPDQIENHRADLLPDLYDVILSVQDIGAGFGLSLDSVMAANLRKLEARYPKGFSTDAARAHHEKAGT